MNKQSAITKKTFSKKPTVKDPSPEISLAVPDEAQSLLLETKLREKLEKSFPTQPRFNWVKVKLPRKLKREQKKQWTEENIKNQIIEKNIDSNNPCVLKLNIHNEYIQLRISAFLIPQHTFLESQCADPG